MRPAIVDGLHVRDSREALLLRRYFPVAPCLVLISRGDRGNDTGDVCCRRGGRGENVVLSLIGTMLVIMIK
jgi:hypothetical protein